MKMFICAPMTSLVQVRREINFTSSFCTNERTKHEKTVQKEDVKCMTQEQCGSRQLRNANANANGENGALKRTNETETITNCAMHKQIVRKHNYAYEAMKPSKQANK